MKLVKIFSLIFVVLAIVNIVLYGMGKSNELIFWIGLAILALATWILKKFK